MSIEVPRIPELVLSPEMTPDQQIAVTGMFAALTEDPGRAKRVLEFLFKDWDRYMLDATDEAIAEKVEEGFEATANGKYLEFDEATEDKIFTEESRALARRVHKTSGEVNRVARRTNFVHRLLSVTNLVLSPKEEDGEDSSVA